MKIDIYTNGLIIMDVSQTQPIGTVEQEKARLRLARLAQHKATISKAIQSGNDKDLSRACSGFVALFRGTNQSKKSK